MVMRRYLRRIRYCAFAHRETLSNTSIRRSVRPFIRLSVCPMPLAQNDVFSCYGYHRTLIGSPMLKVKSICHRGRLVIGSDRNGRRVTYRLQPSER